MSTSTIGGGNNNTRVRKRPTTAHHVMEDVNSENSGDLNNNTARSHASSSYYHPPALVQRLLPNNQPKTTVISSKQPPQSNLNNTMDFAKSAPKAGYLWKLGTNVKEYKRRFFVLKPTTYLFYFLSESDSEPRGCIDLEKYHTTVSSFQKLPDGRCRFQLGIGGSSRAIQLEARSHELAQEWISALSTERFSHYQQLVTQKEEIICETKQQVTQLQKKVELLEKIEKERDDSRREANDWMNKYMQLQQDVTNCLKPFCSLDDEDDDLPGQIESTLARLTSQIHTLEEQVNSSSVKMQEASSENELLNKRMQKAEKLITKLWEENCSSHDVISKLKRERKILAKEVKSLLTENAQRRENISPPQQVNRQALFLGSAEKRLLYELEEDIMSSLKLHDKFLATSRGEIVSPVVAKSSHHEKTASVKPIHQEDSSIAAPLEQVGHEINANTKESPSKSSICAISTLHDIRNASSLLQGDDDDAEEEEEEHKFIPNSPIKPRLLMLDNDKIIDQDEGNTTGISDTGCHDAVGTFSSPADDLITRNNNNSILLLLDEEEKTITSSKILKQISEAGCATATLHCPLAEGSTRNNNDDDVVHITFYTRKIGIQFQKIPLAPIKKSASTSRISEDIRISEQDNSQSKNSRKFRSIMDLKAVAAFSNGEKPKKIKNEPYCQVPQPIDAVFVCGFCGFDEDQHRSKPKIGSRLIAFDGISIEVGKWTFDSVRKAIHAREKRPLTLSFRNDVLTREQRDIIIKAATEIGDNASLTSSKIWNTLQPITEDWFFTAPLPSMITTGKSDSSSFPGDYSTVGSRSVSSFSDAGASTATSIVSSVRPLVASILSGLSSTASAGAERPKFQYLERDSRTRSDDSNSHQLDFQAGLL